VEGEIGGEGERGGEGTGVREGVERGEEWREKGREGTG